MCDVTYGRPLRSNERRLKNDLINGIPNMKKNVKWFLIKFQQEDGDCCSKKKKSFKNIKEKENSDSNNLKSVLLGFALNF